MNQQENYYSYRTTLQYNKNITTRYFVDPLLEDLALIEGSRILDAFPSPIRIDQRLSLLISRIQFLPGVAFVVNLPVGAQLECQVVTAPDPNTGNRRIVVFAEQADGSKSVLAHLVQALEHA